MSHVLVVQSLAELVVSVCTSYWLQMELGTPVSEVPRVRGCWLLLEGPANSPLNRAFALCEVTSDDDL